MHAGRVIDAGSGASAPPIHLSTTFERDPDGQYPRGYTYATFDNSNRLWLETAVTAFEGGAAAIATASGMGAVASVLSSLNPGDRVIVSYDLFQGTARLLNDQLRRYGIEIDAVDAAKPDEIRAAISGRTRLIWIDIPSNPLMRITDIAERHRSGPEGWRRWSRPDYKQAFDAQFGGFHWQASDRLPRFLAAAPARSTSAGPNATAAAAD